MSTTVVIPEQAENTTATIDTKSFIANRNAADQARKEGKEAPAAPVAAADDSDAPVSHPKNRAERRAQARLLREIGELKGRLSAFEELGASRRVEPKAEAPKTIKADDPEPERAAFTDESGYLRALARWEGRQEARKQVTETVKATTEQQESQKLINQMAEKAVEDFKLIPDWKEYVDDGNAVKFNPEEHPTLMGLLASSKQQAFVLYHLSKNPEIVKELLALTPTPGAQIRAFANLEGEVKMEYNHFRKAAGGADPEKGKEAKVPEKAEQARATAAEREIRKPKPSSEVVARGGTPPPDEPAIGSAAWMARRNQAQFIR
jgi:hypothetical protein